jgi:ribosomal protein L17
MRNVQRTLVIALSILAVGLVVGCGDSKKKSKAGCAKLAEQIGACGRNIGLKGDEDEKAEDCEKKLKAGDKIVETAVKCAKHNQCTQFQECMQKIRDKREVERSAKRLVKKFAEAKDKLKAGKHYSAKSFCDNTEKLTPEMTKWCGNLGKAITETMTAKLIRARDSMKVTYKETSACDTMLGYAIKVGKKAGDDAGKLCQELKAVKDFAYLKEQVAKQMKKERPYFTYSCALSKLKEKTEVATPFALKIRKQMIQLCFYTLGKKVFVAKVPKMRRWCSVKRLYKGYKELKPTDPEIVKLMEEAAKSCEPKPK